MSRLQVFSLLWLSVLWMAAWSDFSLGMFVFGLLVGALVLVVFPLPLLATTVVVRPLPLVRLLAVFLVDLVRASAQVAWLAVRPAPISQGAVVRVPLRGKHELLQAITAELVGLVPGTVVIELDRDGGWLDLHVLDLSDDEHARQTVHEVWHQEHRVRAAFEPDYPRRRAS